MSSEKINKVRRVGTKDDLFSPTAQPDRDHFASLMNQRRVESEHVAKKGAESDTKETHSLFDEVQKLNQRSHYAVHASPEELEYRARDLVAQIDEIKHKLNTPDLKMEGAVRNVLSNKLHHIDDNLKVALSKAGLEYTPPERPTSLTSPVSRFLGMLSHGQDQLGTLAEDVKSMADGKGDISPANMLLIQVKVTSIQQEVELFSSMLNKMLESTKTVLNTQV